MITIPSDLEKFYPPTATVEFGKFFMDDLEYIVFDTSSCEPPEPMVNAIIALRMLDAKTKRILMVNHKSPAGLLEKIQNLYDVVEYKLEDGKVQVLFGLK